MEVTVEAKRKSRISIARPLGSSAHQRYAIMHERCQLGAAPPINRWINHGIKNTNLQYAELYGLVPCPTLVLLVARKSCLEFGKALGRTYIVPLAAEVLAADFAPGHMLEQQRCQGILASRHKFIEQCRAVDAHAAEREPFFPIGKHPIGCKRKIAIKMMWWVGHQHQVSENG